MLPEIFEDLTWHETSGVTISNVVLYDCRYVINFNSKGIFTKRINAIGLEYEIQKFFELDNLELAKFNCVLDYNLEIQKAAFCTERRTEFEKSIEVGIQKLTKEFYEELITLNIK